MTTEKLSSQVGRLVTMLRSERHGCSLKMQSRGVPCTECLKIGNDLREHLESMLRLSYMTGHDDHRAGRMQEPERGVMAALRAYANKLWT